MIYFSLLKQLLRTSLSTHLHNCGTNINVQLKKKLKTHIRPQWPVTFSPPFKSFIAAFSWWHWHFFFGHLSRRISSTKYSTSSNDFYFINCEDGLILFVCWQISALLVIIATLFRLAFFGLEQVGDYNQFFVCDSHLFLWEANVYSNDYTFSFKVIC